MYTNKVYLELATEVTDDAAAVEQMGYKVKLYLDAYNNIKVTTPEDLALAEMKSSLKISESCYNPTQGGRLGEP